MKISYQNKNKNVHINLLACQIFTNSIIQFISNIRFVNWHTLTQLSQMHPQSSEKCKKRCLHEQLQLLQSDFYWRIIFCIICIGEIGRSVVAADKISIPELDGKYIENGNLLLTMMEETVLCPPFSELRLTCSNTFWMWKLLVYLGFYIL